MIFRPYDVTSNDGGLFRSSQLGIRVVNLIARTFHCTLCAEWTEAATTLSVVDSVIYIAEVLNDLQFPHLASVVGYPHRAVRASFTLKEGDETIPKLEG